MVGGNMKEECARLFREAWENHRGCLLGAVLGALIAILILLFGFWRILFIGICVAFGLWLGNRIDKADDGWLQEFQENGVGDLLAQIRQKRGRL